MVGEAAQAALAIVAVEDESEAVAATARLKTRGILVNAVDRVALCDFTLPAIVDRDPVLIAIGTGGASAGLAKALRQRLERLLPQSLGRLADDLSNARDSIRGKFPDSTARREAIDVALSESGPLDPFGSDQDVSGWLFNADKTDSNRLETIALTTADPDDLTLRQARLLASATTIYHTPNVPAAILDRARADATRIQGPPAENPGSGLTLVVSI